MSKVLPRQDVDIAEHSICQPGRPKPQGESQPGSPSLEAFHKTKSRASCLLSPTSIRAPASSSSGFLRDRRPYSGNCGTEKYTSPLAAAYAAPLLIRVFTMLMISLIRSEERRVGKECR